MNYQRPVNSQPPVAPKSDEGGSTLNSQPGAWKGVFFDGPQSDQNHDADEIPVWVVYVGNEEAEPIGKVYSTHSYAYAASLARSIARERNLELIDEAMPA